MTALNTGIYKSLVLASELFLMSLTYGVLAKYINVGLPSSADSKAHQVHLSTDQSCTIIDQLVTDPS